MSAPLLFSALPDDMVAEKVDINHLEHHDSLDAGPSTRPTHADAALEILGDQSTHLDISAEDDARILKKIDLWVMPVIVIVYALQQLDKSSLSYTSVFGIVEQTGMLQIGLMLCFTPELMSISVRPCRSTVQVG